MVLSAYMHGLRVSELVDLRWEQIDFRTAALHVRRVKQGTPSTHPIPGDELRALRRLQREQEPKSLFVFSSGRGASMSLWEVTQWLNRLTLFRGGTAKGPTCALCPPAAFF